jgi:hypothetical protein
MFFSFITPICGGDRASEGKGDLVIRNKLKTSYAYKKSRPLTGEA